MFCHCLLARGVSLPVHVSPLDEPPLLQCVELKPDWAKGYSRLGAAYYGLEDWEQAIAAYEDGLRVDSANAALQSALSDAISAKNRSQAGGSQLFGPDAMARLALDPRGRLLLEDSDFMARLKMVAAHPEMLNGMLGDEKMQLVGVRM